MDARDVRKSCLELSAAALLERGGGDFHDANKLTPRAIFQRFSMKRAGRNRCFWLR